MTAGGRSRGPWARGCASWRSRQGGAHQPVPARGRDRHAPRLRRGEADGGPHRGRPRGLAEREQPPGPGAPPTRGDGPARRNQRRARDPQAEHPRRLRQGLVRGPRGGSLGFPARGQRRARPRGPRAGRRLGQARRGRRELRPVGRPPAAGGGGSAQTSSMRSCRRLGTQQALAPYWADADVRREAGDRIMAETEALTIELPDSLAETVREAVEAGEYASTAEVVRDALRVWEEQRALRGWSDE